MADVIEVVGGSVTLEVTQGSSTTVGLTAPAGPQGIQGVQGPPGTTDFTQLQNVPATFPPSSHTHPSSEITDFNSAASAAAPVQSVAGRTGTISLVKADVGLTNADNTSDLDKPISTATQTALDGKAATAHTHPSSAITDFSTAAAAVAPVQSVAGKTGSVALVKADVGLGSVDNTTDLNKPISTATQIGLDGKAATSHTHTASQVTDFNAAAAAAASVQSVAGRTGAVTLAVADVADAVATSDGRLSDARPPTAHKATHQAGGTDALTPADIGAATSAQGSLADSAVQPGDLATVATTGSYSDLSNVPATFAPASHTHTPSEVGLGNVSNSAQVTSVTGTAPIVSSGGTTPAISISAATASAAGSMSGADKTKLDGIATSANNYTHPNHSGDVTSVGDGATTIANDAVTNAKLANVTTQTIKGRATASTGDPEDLTASQVRTILNVADGAEVNVQSNWTEANSGSDAFIQNKPTLGGAAALNVGTAASTVAAGDDSRFTDAASLTTGTLADARLSGGVSRVMHAIAVGFVLN